MNATTLIGFESVEAAKTFVTAGRALITIKSLSTDQHYTFRIRKKKGSDVIFVSALQGPEHFTYIGFIRFDLFFHGAKSKIGSDTPTVKAFQFFFNDLIKGVVHKKLEVYHHGVCGRCGRTLTHPESILTGLGPECIKKS